MINSVYSCDLHKEFDKELEKIYESKVPLNVKASISNSTKDFFIVSKDVLLMMLNEFKFTILVTEEETGETILEFEELGLIGYGDTLKDSIESLIKNINVYAEHYSKNINLYSNSINRGNHIIYLIKIWTLSLDDLIKSFNFISSQSLEFTGVDRFSTK